MITIQIIIIFTILFLASPSFANEIKYTLGPSCKNKNVICPNENEIPVCIVLDPRVHVEQILNSENHNINRFEPACGDEENFFKVGCIDTLSKNSRFAENVSIECVELVKCENENNKLSVSCSDGKIAKCLGSDETPSCDKNSICENDSLPVCDYVWQANL